jgi:hypothetical protein
MPGHDADRPAEEDDVVIALPVVPRTADGECPNIPLCW